MTCVSRRVIALSFAGLTGLAFSQEPRESRPKPKLEGQINRMALNLLASDVKLQDALKLTPAQRTKVVELYKQESDRHRAESDALLKSKGPLKDLSLSEKKERFNQVFARNREIDPFVARDLVELLDRDQEKRLRQAEFRKSGMKVLSREEVTRGLQLTAPQSAEFDRLARDINTQLKPAPGKKLTAAWLRDIQRQALTGFEALLNAEQRAAWGEALGPPYDFEFPPLGPSPPRPKPESQSVEQAKTR